MNELVEEFPDLVVLAFPCNQFGHQENAKNGEIKNLLKHVRPGNGFVPQFPIFEKVEVNGEKAAPLFAYLKETLPFPSDDPDSFMKNSQAIIWSPVRRSDIAWNFEKFLIGKDGLPVKRYSRYFLTSSIAKDISLLSGK